MTEAVRELRRLVESDRGTLRAEMFCKAFEDRPSHFPVTTEDIEQSVDSMFEATSASRGWSLLCPYETVVSVGISLGYGNT